MYGILFFRAYSFIIALSSDIFPATSVMDFLHPNCTEGVTEQRTGLILCALASSHEDDYIFRMKVDDVLAESYEHL